MLLSPCLVRTLAGVVPLDGLVRVVADAPDIAAAVVQVLAAQGTDAEVADADGDVVLEQLGLAQGEVEAEEVAVVVAQVAGTPTVAVRCGPRARRHVRRVLAPLVSGPGPVEAVAVRHAPAVAVRGVVEGFYGVPWTEEVRLSQLDFIAEVGMNAFLYSPKDDPWLRERWREPYPPERVEALRRLVGHAQALGIDVTFAVSPGLSMRASDPEDLRALVAKLEAAWDAGVRSFAIAFDDIDPAVHHSEEDVARFGGDLAPAAAKQAYVVNEVHAQLAHTHPDCAPLQFVPTDYFSFGDSDYRARLSELMHPDVLVHWTGIGICAPVITGSQTRDAAEAYGHGIVLWDNFPVNDFLTRALLLGPYVGRTPDLAPELYAIYSNPMPQAIASRIGIACVAAWAWNPDGYDAERVWREAVALVGGDSAEHLQVLADLCRPSPMLGRDVPALAPLADLVAAAEPTASAEDGTPAAGAGALKRAGSAAGAVSAEAPVAAVRALADRVDAAARGLRSDPSLHELVAEVTGWLDALESLPTLLRACADLAEGDAAPDDVAALRALAATAPRHELAVGVLRPLVRRLLAATGAAPAATSETASTPRAGAAAATPAAAASNGAAQSGALPPAAR